MGVESTATKGKASARRGSELSMALEKGRGGGGERGKRLRGEGDAGDGHEAFTATVSKGNRGGGTRGPPA